MMLSSPYIYTPLSSLAPRDRARSWLQPNGIGNILYENEEKISKWDNLAIFSMKTHSYFHVTPSLSRTTF